MCVLFCFGGSCILEWIVVSLRCCFVIVRLFDGVFVNGAVFLFCVCLLRLSFCVCVNAFLRCYCVV